MRIAQIGGVLIFISGVVNVLLGVQVGAVVYEIYPGGRLGHVGITSGLAAIVIGVVIVHGAAPRLGRGARTIETEPMARRASARARPTQDGIRETDVGQRREAKRRRRAGLIIFALGLMGAITGALYVGTAGMVLCSLASGWALFSREP